MSAVVRVLIADDHPVVRSGIKGMLEPDPGFEVAGEASSGLEAGAVGYLLKDAPHEEIARAVRAAARGETTLAPAIAQRLMQRVRSPAGDALSAREIAVLQLAARGLSNSEIAKELFVSTTTAKAHLVHIYAKLGVNDRTAAVERGIIRLDQT